MLTTRLKRLIYPLYIYPKISAAARRKVHGLYYACRQGKMPDKPAGANTLKLFSNLEEDGIVVWLMALLGIEKGYFLDIGSNDCINSNCANLAFNFNWDGVFMDADAQLLNIGQRNYRFFGKTKTQQLKFVQGFLYPHNINEVVGENATTTEVDFMSVDIDGDDYGVWQALNIVQPKVVVVENKIEYGAYDIVVPATKEFQPAEWGASIVSMDKLAAKKGYSLVAVNSQGFNAFFMRNDLFGQIPSLEPVSVRSVLQSEEINAAFFPENFMQPLVNRVKLATK